MEHRFIAYPPTPKSVIESVHKTGNAQPHPFLHPTPIKPFLHSQQNQSSTTVSPTAPRPSLVPTRTNSVSPSVPPVASTGISRTRSKQSIPAEWDDELSDISDYSSDRITTRKMQAFRQSLPIKKSIVVKESSEGKAISVTKATTKQSAMVKSATTSDDPCRSIHLTRNVLPSLPSKNTRTLPEDPTHLETSSTLQPSDDLTKRKPHSVVGKTPQPSSKVVAPAIISEILKTAKTSGTKRKHGVQTSSASSTRNYGASVDGPALVPAKRTKLSLQPTTTIVQHVDESPSPPRPRFIDGQCSGRLPQQLYQNLGDFDSLPPLRSSDDPTKVASDTNQGPKTDLTVTARATKVQKNPQHVRKSTTKKAKADKVVEKPSSRKSVRRKAAPMDVS
jgi:hypothetical protein